MTEFTITHPIRMDALYPEARIGDLFVATHDRHPDERVILMSDSRGQAAFVPEYGCGGMVSRQFGPEWTLQHVGPSWITRVAEGRPMDGPCGVAECVLKSTAPHGHQPSFSAAFCAGVRFAIQCMGGRP